MRMPQRGFIYAGSIYRVLLLLMLVTLLPLLLVQGGIYYQWTQSRKQAEWRNNAEMAAAVSRAFHAYVKGIHRQQCALGQALAEGEFTPEEMNALLLRSVEGYAAVRRLSWVSPEGEVVASSGPETVGEDLREQHYYRQLLNGKDRVVSDLLARPDGEMAFMVAREILDDTGAARGIIIAAVDPTRLGEQALEITRKVDGAFTILDAAGRCVYHSAAPALPFEQRDWRARYPQIRRALGGERIDGVFPWGDDTRERFTTLMPIADTGWLASASRPEAVAMAPVRQGARRDFSILLLAALLSFFIAAVLARRITSPIRRLRRDVIAFGAGEMERRAEPWGPTEVHDLATAFNEMAEMIQAQQEELAAQNEELQAQQEELAAQNEELQAQQEELAAQNEELQAQQEELTAQGEELQSQNNELARERAFLSTAVEILPLPMIFVSKSGEVLLANTACRGLLGDVSAPGWWKGISLFSPKTQTPIPMTSQPLYAALQGRESDALEAVMALPDGREMPILLQAAPIRTEGEAVAAVGILQDITALRAEDRAKDQFLAVLSHELLTPLTTILGWLQLLEEQADDPEMRARALSVITRNAHRQKRLVDDLLDVSRIIHGKLLLRPEATDLWRLVEQQVESAQHMADERGVTVTLAPPPGDAAMPVHVDPARTTQVIANLLTNALKFTGEGGTVTIRGAMTETSAVVTVQDTGKGIPPELLSHLFHPFRQIQRSERHGGLGLGLALVKGIVELHHGQVSVSSAGDGQGSTFTVELPLSR